MKKIMIVAALIFWAARAFGQSPPKISVTSSDPFFVGFGGPDNFVHMMFISNDGSVIMGGKNSTNGEQAAVSKTNMSGTLMWAETWGAQLTDSYDQTDYNPNNNRVTQALLWPYSDLDTSAIACFDGTTGHMLWKIPREVNSNYVPGHWRNNSLAVRVGSNPTCFIFDSTGKETGKFPIDVSYANWMGGFRLRAMGDTLWIVCSQFIKKIHLPDGKAYWSIPVPGTRIVQADGALDKDGNLYAGFTDAYDLQTGYTYYQATKVGSNGSIIFNRKWLGWTYMPMNLNNWLMALAVNEPQGLLACFGGTNWTTDSSNTGRQSAYLAILNSITGDTLWTEKWNYPTAWSGTNWVDGYFVGNNLVLLGVVQPAWNLLQGFVKTYTFTIIDGVERVGSDIPEGFSLSQNYPNPFNPATKIEFKIAKRSFVNLRVYNLLGQEVSILVNEEKSPGTYKADFNGLNLPSGVYLYRLTAGSFSETKKMLMMK